MARTGGPRTEEGRARSLTNLRQGPKRKTESHGAYAVDLSDARVQTLAEQITQALTADRNSALRPLDLYVVRNFAKVQLQLETLEQWMADSGPIDKRTGKPKAPMQLYLELHRMTLGYADRLGMSPQARRKMGMDTGNKPRSWLAEMHSDTGDAEDKEV